MSRRKLHWRRIVGQSGDVDKNLPRQKVIGKGVYWSKMPLFTGIGGGNRKSVCSLPVTPEKEAKIRQWVR